MDTTHDAAGHGPVATIMKGGGFYNLHSQFQKMQIVRSIKNLEQAAALAPLPSTGSCPFRIADLGCSQGANSVAPIAAVLRVLQSRARTAADGMDPSVRPPAFHVEVVHEDLPGNDWKSLFGVVYGEGSYMPGPGECPELEVFATAVGRSFYERLFPPASVHLATAFACMHWLPGLPPAPRPVDTINAYGTQDKTVYEAFRQFANGGLRKFFELRAAEVAPGGSLVCHFPVHNPGRDDVNPMINAFSEAVLRMVSEGLLGPDDVANMTFPHFLYQPDDVRTLLAEAADTWTVHAAEDLWVYHPAHEEYLAGQLTKVQIVQIYSDMLRAISEQHFVHVLTRRFGPEAAEGLVRDLYERMKGVIADQLAPLGGRIMFVWVQRKW